MDIFQLSLKAAHFFHQLLEQRFINRSCCSYWEKCSKKETTQNTNHFFPGFWCESANSYKHNETGSVGNGGKQTWGKYVAALYVMTLCKERISITNWWSFFISNSKQQCWKPKNALMSHVLFSLDWIKLLSIYLTVTVLQMLCIRYCSRGGKIPSITYALIIWTWLHWPQ